MQRARWRLDSYSFIRRIADVEQILDHARQSIDCLSVYLSYVRQSVDCLSVCLSHVYSTGSVTVMVTAELRRHGDNDAERQRFPAGRFSFWKEIIFLGELTHSLQMCTDFRPSPPKC
ncbi:hypothetical protein AVEN_238080-1 [Araneus ventricosus]|uniref:Uncharacterized protein n=1 Tax=Araneus ventricosus TaxID=182803 RepID=A0A4Y2WZN5_ARAVE|nr:hypothetical protein AVEN_119299-1 [Araneus ventricosus]GBO42793.1 hypothetical protein AVEN_238080-1 [Araneus ventricosus]